MLEAYITRAPQSTTTITYFGFSVVFCIFLSFLFFFFSIITNILENVLSPKNKSTAHHSVRWPSLPCVVASNFHSRGDGFVAFNSALAGLLNMH